MNIRFTKKFLKQVGQLKNSRLSDEIETVIIQAEKAGSIQELKKIKKLAGYKTFYRIRVGDYRIGLNFENNILEFVTFDHRKDIYKYFP
jgi:mRNA interferase RelE/StbE